MKLIKFIFAFALVLSYPMAQAQPLDWAVSMGSTGNDDGRAIAVDASGNVYTTGNFTGTVDFDPGAGVSTLTATGSSNIYIQKLDASGNFVWAKAMTGNDISRSYGIVVDANGNVYSTGLFAGDVDFDPGAGSTILSSGSAIWRDYYVQKLDANGNLVWVHSFGEAHEDIGYGITLDAFGDLLITGAFSDSVDFDPGVGVTAFGSYNKDIFIQKLDANGNFIWARSASSTPGNGGDDQGNDIVTDAAGNVYVIGTFAGEVDFDPGAGVVQLTNDDFDGFVEKFDVNGNFAWVRQFACTGASFGNAICSTANGDILVTGLYQFDLDGDLTAAASVVTSIGGWDTFLFRIDGSGNAVWFNHFGGDQDEYARTVAEDASGNIFLAGDFRDTVDFDPSAGTSLFYSMGNSDIFIQKLNASGAFQSLMQMGGLNDETAFDISIANGSIYATGYFKDTVNLDPFAGVSTHISSGGDDAFVLKINGGPAGIQDFNHSTDIIVFPNPTNGKVSFEMGESVNIEQISVMNASGQIILNVEKNLNGSKELDLSSFSAGLYFLKIHTTEGNYCVKIVRD